MGLRSLLSPRFLLKAFAILTLLFITTSFYSCYHASAISWARYKWLSKPWSSCQFRAYPFIQIVGTGSYTISWETNCELGDDVEFGWTAVPLQVEGGDGGGVRRKEFISGSGEKREVMVHAENTLGRDSIEYVHVGTGHRLYRVKLKNLPAEHLLEYFVRLSVKHAPFQSSFPILPDLTSPIPPAVPPAIHPIEIAIVGDNQSGRDTFTKICRNIEKRNPHVLIHLGDMVQHAWKPEEWQQQFFDPIGWYTGLASRCPMIAVHGNHDVWSKGRYRGKYMCPADLTKKERSSGDSDDEEENPLIVPPRYYHAISVGPLRVIIIDANVETDEQATWLEQELSQPSTQKSPYKIVLTHISPFIEFWNPMTWAAGEKSWPEYVRSRLQPLFEKYRVDLVLSGHQHNYQRGLNKGVNYITSGGAGGELDKRRVEDFHVYKQTLFKHHYMMMSVARSGLSIRVYSKGDRLLDSFYIPRSFARKMKPSEMLPQ